VKKKILKSPWFVIAVTLIVCFGIIASPWGPDNRSAEDIAIVFGLPIIIFDTVLAYGMSWLVLLIVSQIPTRQQGTLPLQSYSRKVRVISVIAIILILSLAVLIPASIAMTISSVLYPHLGVGWASADARHAAVWIFIVGILPTAVVAIFTVGAIVGWRFRSSLSFAMEGIPTLMHSLIFSLLRNNI
jgi:hypothetical protein